MKPYDYDPAKARSNIHDHGITFDEGYIAIEDRFSIWFSDPEHSITEERLIALGFCYPNVLFVSFIFQDEPALNRYRIISARKAEPDEAKYYWQNRPKD